MTTKRLPILGGGRRLYGTGQDSDSEVVRSEYTIPNEAVAKIGLEQSEGGEITLGSYSQLSSIADLKAVKFANVGNIA